MPIYEYRTESGRTFELFFRRADDAGETATDPATGEVGTRIISGAGFAFKGSGFYLTDYGKNAHRSSGSAPAKGGEGSGGDGAKGEGAAAAGGEAKGSGEAKPGGEAKPAEAKPATAAPATPAPSSGGAKKAAE